MNFISASYNMYHNSIDITTFDGYILRIDCNKAEEGLKTTAWTDHVLNAMAIDNPLEYARLYLFSSFYILFEKQLHKIFCKIFFGFIRYFKCHI